MLVPYYQDIENPEEVFDREIGRNDPDRLSHLFINKGWKMFSRGYFVKKEDNGIMIKTYYARNEEDSFFIPYENIKSIHYRKELLWDRYRVGVVEENANLIQGLFENFIKAQECKNCVKNKDGMIIDFSKLSPMQKYRIGNAIYKILIDESTCMSESVKDFSEDSEAGKEMRGWLAAVNEIIPIARELGSK